MKNSILSYIAVGFFATSGVLIGLGHIKNLTIFYALGASVVTMCMVIKSQSEMNDLSNSVDDLSNSVDDLSNSIRESTNELYRKIDALEFPIMHSREKVTENMS